MHGLHLEMVDLSLKNVCHNIFVKVMSYGIKLLKFLTSQHYNNKKIYSIKRIKLDLASAVRLCFVCGPASVEHSSESLEDICSENRNVEVQESKIFIQVSLLLFLLIHPTLPLHQSQGTCLLSFS